MTYGRLVQVGRVVLLTYGAQKDSVAVIVDIIDHQRVLIQGPSVKRQEISFKRCLLTDVTIKIPRAIGSAALAEVFKKQNIQEMFGKTAWAQKIKARKIRANLSDFDRFKVMIAKKQRRMAIAKQLKTLKK